MTERIVIDDENEDTDDGRARVVTVPSRGDQELDALEIIINEFYSRLPPTARYRIARYIADRFYAEARVVDAS